MAALPLARIPLLSVTVAGHQAAGRLLTTRARSPCAALAPAALWASRALRGRSARGSPARGGSGAAAPAAELAESLRCAPPGMVKALEQVLEVDGSLVEALGGEPQTTLALRGAQRALEVVAGDLTQAVGPGKLLDTPWILAGKEELRNQLAEIFARYLCEILEIVQVSSAFKELSLPVRRFRTARADAAVSPRLARQLWAPAESAAAESGAGREDPGDGLERLGVGAAVLDGYIAPQVACRAREELEDLARQGRLSDFSSSTCNPGSRHLWLRLEEAPPSLRRLGEALAALPGALEAKSSAAPGLRMVPALMAAVYGPGAHYVPHKDMYSGGSAGFENTRLLTILCYLNPDWKPGDGGELRVFKTADSGSAEGGPGRLVPQLLQISADHSESTTSSACDPETFVDIEPLLGRVVMFRSREAWHGIQESKTERWAVTLWLLADLP
ncbi:unnamed protein product [Effrenium voratum]|nr:unnamed protein product [Effrenium voratum]